jgi:hypothetical protein
MMRIRVLAALATASLLATGCSSSGLTGSTGQLAPQSVMPAAHVSHTITPNEPCEGAICGDTGNYTFIAPLQNEKNTLVLAPMNGCGPFDIGEAPNYVPKSTGAFTPNPMSIPVTCAPKIAQLSQIVVVAVQVHTHKITVIGDNPSISGGNWNFSSVSPGLTAQMNHFYEFFVARAPLAGLHWYAPVTPLNYDGYTFTIPEINAGAMSKNSVGPACDWNAWYTYTATATGGFWPANTVGIDPVNCPGQPGFAATPKTKPSLYIVAVSLQNWISAVRIAHKSHDTCHISFSGTAIAGPVPFAANPEEFAPLPPGVDLVNMNQYLFLIAYPTKGLGDIDCGGGQP